MQFSRFYFNERSPEGEKKSGCEKASFDRILFCHNLSTLFSMFAHHPLAINCVSEKSHRIEYTCVKNEG